MKQKVFTPRHISSYPALRCIIGNLASSILQIIHNGLFMVKGMVYSFFKLATTGRIQGLQPSPKPIPDGRLCFLTFLFPFFPGKFFIKIFQIKETITEGHSFFSRKLSSTVPSGDSVSSYSELMFKASAFSDVPLEVSQRTYIGSVQ